MTFMTIPATISVNWPVHFPGAHSGSGEVLSAGDEALGWAAVRPAGRSESPSQLVL